MAGLPTAARYLPASDEVGGDWYDLFELPRGRLGVAIGDVVGHGLRAAALMGQLRTALHAYALEEHGPARTLELLDRFVQAMPEQFRCPPAKPWSSTPTDWSSGRGLG